MHNTARIHLGREFRDLALHLSGDDFLLNLVSVFEEFLNDVVAKDILHELKCVGFDFSENLVLLVAVRRLKLLLDESRAVLIATEFYNVPCNVLNRGVKVPV